MAGRSERAKGNRIEFWEVKAKPEGLQRETDRGRVSLRASATDRVRSRSRLVPSIRVNAARHRPPSDGVSVRIFVRMATPLRTSFRLFAVSCGRSVRRKQKKRRDETE